ncbi:MAG: helix-turn-helix domain-containing protein [Acidobacteria bacterium]|nr:helix-turn-helix domain-containing protein [Acidobacteriota bacterium]
MNYRADIIRAEKAAQNKTLEDLSAATGLNPNTIAEICKGKENLELNSLRKVADALGLDMQLLFSRPSRNRLAA